MLISYEPMADVLSITLQTTPVAQSQVQGSVSVGFDSTGSVVSVTIPEASSVLWEHGGQVNVALPQTTQTVVTQQVVPTQVVPAQVVAQPVVGSVSETVVTRVVE